MKKKNKGLTPPPMSPCMYFHDCIALTITADFPIFTTKSYFKLIKYLLAHYLNNGDYESRREKKKYFRSTSCFPEIGRWTLRALNSKTFFVCAWKHVNKADHLVRVSIAWWQKSNKPKKGKQIHD